MYPMLLEHVTGCLLGAAIGDALGMPGESMPTDLKHCRQGYRRAWRGHPSAGLEPGSYTDDTQMMMLAGRLLVEGSYTEEEYASHLAEMYAAGELRFPDGSVASACRRILTTGFEGCGVNSDTAGCIPATVPFAVVCHNPADVRRSAAGLCGVTHTSRSARAAAVTAALLIHTALHGDGDAIADAQHAADREYPPLGGRIREALRFESEGITLDSAISVIGNDVTVYQTLPLAFFLMSRYEEPGDLLAVASGVGGNTDTIACICGAYAGAKLGMSALPGKLTETLENRKQIEGLAGQLHRLYIKKIKFL